MTQPIPPITRSLLEKAASDNGFDQDMPAEGGWLSFASTQCPLRIWLGPFGTSLYLVGFSQSNVVQALGEYGTKFVVPLPSGASGGHSVPDVPALHSLLRRALLLSKTLPNELLNTFRQQTATMPRTTEEERLVVQRVGQNLFRQGLLDLWEGRCAITGLAVPELLRASHIKPWADCATDEERLDVYNGLLLAPHLDAAFDRGFITVDDDGRVVLSSILSEESIRLLDLGRPMRVRPLQKENRVYLPWHREKVFRT
jgi:hypothetical protein